MLFLFSFNFVFQTWVNVQFALKKIARLKFMVSFQSIIWVFFSKQFQSCNKSLVNHACLGLGPWSYLYGPSVGWYSPSMALVLGLIRYIYSRCVPGFHICGTNCHIFLELNFVLLSRALLSRGDFPCCQSPSVTK